MLAGVRVVRLEELSDLLAEAFNPRIPPAKINREHSPHVTRKMTLLEEVCQNELV
jgi:hypothetical protein